MFYLVIMVLLYFLFFVEQLKKSNIIKIIFFIVFFSLSAFRYKTGLDWIGYLEYYDAILNGVDTILGVEIGYIYLMKIFVFFNLDYYCMQVFIALFSTVAIFVFFYDNSKYPLFCLASYFSIYYLRYNMGLQRQIIALSFCLFSFYYLKRNRMMISLLIWSISLLFHFSAIVFLIVFAEKYFYIDYKKQIVLIGLFILLVGIFKINIVNFILNILNKISIFLNFSYLSNKILFYVNDEFYSRSIPLGKILIIKSFFISFIYILYDKIKNIRKNYLYMLTTTYVLLSCLSHQFYVLDRLEGYFQIFSIIIFSYIFDIFDSKIYKSISLFLLAFIFCWLNIRNFVLQKKERYYFRYVPYYSIFNKKDDIQRFRAENGDIK